MRGTRTQSNLIDRIASFVPQVGDLDRLGLRESRSTFGSFRPICRWVSGNQFLVHAVGGAEMKFPLLWSKT